MKTKDCGQMDRKDIGISLRQLGLNWSAAAEAIGCSASHLSGVAGRTTTSRTVAEKLCTLIGCSIEEVFPDVPHYHAPTTEERRQEMVARAKQILNSEGRSDCRAQA
jgi:hypothetical protein